MDADWSHAMHCVDVDKAWSVFCKTFTNILDLDQVASVKEVRIKHHVPNHGCLMKFLTKVTKVLSLPLVPKGGSMEPLRNHFPTGILH